MRIMMWLTLWPLTLWLAGDASTVMGSSSLQVKEILTIAGNFSLNGKFTNLAQYDMNSGEWSSSYEPDLYVYGESNGVIWDTKVNRSSRLGPGGTLVDELLVVGAFDTVSKTSQMLYCSVGVWTGLSFNKVGEGLCPRGGGSSSGMLILTSSLGSKGDLFVGGHFDSRVWDGDKFTNVYNIAYFHAASYSWLPLDGGKLTCRQEDSVKCLSRVNALEWDEESKTLFIGGKFNYLGSKPITSGLCMWSRDTGLISFSSDVKNGLSLSGATAGDGEATVLTYDSRAQSLFVAGSYSFVAGVQCSSIAVWHRPTDAWTCLDTPDYSISTVTAMCLDLSMGALYLAGWASFQAQWQGRDWGSPYAISRIDVSGYIQYHFKLAEEKKQSKPQKANSNNANARHTLLRRRLVTFPESDIKSRSYPHSNFPSNNSSLDSKSSLSMLNATISAINHSRRLKNNNFDLKWEWLSGFSGGNGPIFSIVLGRNKFKNCLFITGAFNNGPPIVLWQPFKHTLRESPVLRNITAGNDDSIDCTEACVLPVGSNVNIHGLITSVSQLRIPVERSVDIGPDTPPTPNDGPDSKSTLYFLFVISISIGICLGISITIRCMKSSYDRVPSEEDDYDDIGDISKSRPRRQSVTLGTLSTGGNRTIDLKACYKRAMEARHLTSDEIFVTINPQEIELITRIGEGSFGTVWSGIWRNNSVAVKEFGFAQAAIHGDSQQSESLVEEIIGEAGLMTCLRHPKILQLYGCSLTPQAVWIVCELCEQGSLRMLLDNTHVVLTNEDKISLCMDVADGMLYLHRRKKPIIHRDLKSYNIFVIESHPGKYTAKIGDWGSARAIALSGSPRTMTQGVGTACWLAPEAIKQSHFSKASDVYSFGIVLWEIYSRRRVHVKLSDSQIIARVANDGLRPEVPVYCPWSELMQKCWDEKPSCRPTFKYIVDTLHHIYNQERAERSSLNIHNFAKKDSFLKDVEEDITRSRNFHYSDDSEESRDIGNSF